MHGLSEPRRTSCVEPRLRIQDDHAERRLARRRGSAAIAKPGLAGPAMRRTRYQLRHARPPRRSRHRPPYKASRSLLETCYRPRRACSTSGSAPDHHSPLWDRNVLRAPRVASSPGSRRAAGAGHVQLGADARAERPARRRERERERPRSAGAAIPGRDLAFCTCCSPELASLGLTDREEAWVAGVLPGRPLPFQAHDRGQR